MTISLHRRHLISVGILWLGLFIVSMLLKVEEHSNGGWEGEYQATYGFPFSVAVRRFDMWVPTLKQFIDFSPWALFGNFVVAGVLSVGIVALIVVIAGRRRK